MKLRGDKENSTRAKGAAALAGGEAAAAPTCAFSETLLKSGFIK